MGEGWVNLGRSRAQSVGASHLPLVFRQIELSILLDTVVFLRAAANVGDALGQGALLVHLKAVVSLSLFCAGVDWFDSFKIGLVIGDVFGEAVLIWLYRGWL